MNIIEALKNDSLNLRVDNGDKWLVFQEGKWMVFQRKFGERQTLMLIETQSESDAIAALCDEGD